MSAAILGERCSSKRNRSMKFARSRSDGPDRTRQGLFHLCGADKLSRWQIANLLLPHWPVLPGKIQPDTVKNFQGPPRPQDSSMNCAKVQSFLSFRLPGMAEALAAHPEEIA